MTRRAVTALAAVVTIFTLGACTSSTKPAATPGPTSATKSTTTSTATKSTPPSTVPASKPADHVVVVVMENHSYADIIGNSAAPYLNQLAKRGATFTSMYALTHPSQPNYVALFSGSTHGVTDDACPQTLTGDNLGHQVIAARLTFRAYSEGLPAVGSEVCNAGRYARRHAPWTNFANLPGTVSMPFTSFPADFSRLPALSFVIPDVHDDMHDGTVADGDAWLRSHLQAYASWAATHNSQLVVTWDEDDTSADNHIATIIVGAGIKAQSVTTRVTHYSLLRYLEDQFGLGHLGNAATAARIALPA